MQAIIVTGGKQYVVNEGDTLFIEKLPVEAGDAGSKALHGSKGIFSFAKENIPFGTPRERL